MVEGKRPCWIILQARIRWLLEHPKERAGNLFSVLLLSGSFSQDWPFSPTTRTLVLKTEQSATVIIAHTGVTGGAAAVLSLATAEGGRLAMVAARYIEEKYLNPLRAKRIKREEEAKKEIREEARAKGLALAQARAQTLALADAEWGAWNERRLAAEAKGEPFDEPTPATLRNRSLTMAQLRATGPYIWVTWLPRLLSGESSCEWAAWFKAQHEGSSWTRAPSDFDQAGWLMDHTSLLNEQREAWEKQGCSVLTEAQNSFTLRGSSASLAGKPDLVAQRRDGATVIDAKSGRPSPHHAIQVMVCMYALPRALERYRGLALSGQVAYPDHVVDIPAAAVDEGFIRNLGSLIRRLAAETSARRVPSPMECRFCEITKADCPDRLEEVPAQEGVTDDF